MSPVILILANASMILGVQNVCRPPFLNPNRVCVKVIKKSEPRHRVQNLG